MKGNNLTTVFLITTVLCLVAPVVPAVAQDGGAPLGVHRLNYQAVIYGDMSDDEDCYQCYLIFMGKDQMLYADIDAADMGSCIDSVLEIRSYPKLDLLLTNDNALNTRDSQLVFKAPWTGQYVMCVTDFDDCEFCWNKDGLYESYGPTAQYSDCFGMYGITFDKSLGKYSTLIGDVKINGTLNAVRYCWYFLNYKIRAETRQTAVDIPMGSDFAR